MQQMNYYEMIGFHSAKPCPNAGWPDVPDLSSATLFVDFDGTLTEIAPRPDDIRLDGGVAGLLGELHERTGGNLAIISGRSMDDLERYLPSFAGTMVGSHGIERRIDGKRTTAIDTDAETLSHLHEVVSAWVRHKEGVLLEEKPAALVLHFRQAPEAMGEGERFLSSLVENLDGWVVHHAKMALELMPAGVSKRATVESLLDALPGRMPIALGDDATDEGMLALAVERGGLGIKVGDGESHANYCVPSVTAVHEMLAFWLSQPVGTPCPES